MQTRYSSLSLIGLLVLGVTLTACSANGGGTPIGGGDTTTGDTVPGDTNTGDTGTGVPNTDAPTVDLNSDGTPNGPAPLGCGNAVLTSDEACDDGNVVGGDGCAANCLGVEPGYSCPSPGKPCFVVARCGDSAVIFPEPCDDGNVSAGDGCSATCKVEIGYKCEGSPSVCVPTVCGDGVQEGVESCEDGNTLPFDGCSSDCQKEPDCSTGVCVSECGDGLVLGEECDDGNRISGDGCSDACKTELSYDCSANASCEKLNGECVMRVPAIYRDFAASHPDFGFGAECNGEALGTVDAQLDAEGKPVLSATKRDGTGCIPTPATFPDWYRSGSSNATVTGKILLMPNGSGGFVNRYGANGEQWMSFSDPVWCGNVGEEVDGAPCTFKFGDTPCQTNAANYAGCVQKGTNWNGLFLLDAYDGTPLFFPLDGAAGALTDTDSMGEAKIAEQYGYPSWPWEKEVTGQANVHNFYFTTEVKYWFKYDATTSARFDFLGDDDVWVFVNGVLAADIGGVHVPMSATFTIDRTTGGTYGLTDGNVYPISIFHAERKMEGSSFKLTLSGFQTVRSDCRPVCGDGIIGMGEECDDGINDGGYGECAAGCRLGEFCGDGVVQEGEDCDDGNSLDGDTCGSSCRELVVR